MAQISLEPITSLSRREAVIAQIRRGIVLGALSPGERLTEVGLAATLGVSRATVREALGQLGREGLLTTEPYSGVRVAQLDAAAIRDLAQTRIALDRLAIDAILADRSGRRLDTLTEAWTLFETQIFAGDPVDRHDAHLAFHRAVWDASENVLLAQLWPVVQANLTIALAEDQRARPNPERSHRIHGTLVAAVVSRDAARIDAALRAHTLDTADQLIDLCHSDEGTTA